MDKYEELYRSGLKSVPESGKKSYAVGCYTKDDWKFIHEELMKDGSLEDNLPCDCVECCDIKDHSDTRAVYLLTDEEAQSLKNHPRVKFVNINYSDYKSDFAPPPDELRCDFRYEVAEKQYRNWKDYNQLPSVPDESETGRSGYQLLRCVDNENPWHNGVSAGSSTIIDSRIFQHGDGSDVDVIVGDEGCWIGHVEFQSNSNGVSPKNYVGGNILPGNGTCDVLDLVLDAPYYIDPDFFNADPSNRLEIRWDGTTVPKESAARSWWSDSAQRSVGFSTIGTVGITTSYTRARANGNATSRPTVGTTHGTQCSAATYGRTQGWAYNANKWTINVYNSYGSDFEEYYDLMKLFHLYKPVNPKYGNRNPTISSNSWGYRSTSHRTTGWYFYRGQGIGTSYTLNTMPGFMNYVGYWGDGGRMKGEMLTNSATIAGEEMINAGVIFVGAAGNSNQKQTSPDHPDYNNYWNSEVGAGASLGESTHLEFGLECYNTTNRRGYPQQLGMSGVGTQKIYPVINIGALDDSFDTNGKERKVNYSDMGNEIDCYAPADGILTATNSNSGETRFDTYGDSSTQYDLGFSGSCNTTTVINSFLPVPYTSFRITTSNSNTGTLSTITNSLSGAGSLNASTSPTVGGNDDGYWQIAIPFTVTFAGSDYTTVYVGTNSYLTFDGGYTTYSSLSQSNPSSNKIHVSAADNSCQRLYSGAEGSAPNRTYRLRYEGTNSISGTLGSPNIEWEMIFYENNPTQIDLHVGNNYRVTTNALTSYDAKFSGTSAACPVACGLIATKLQYNRDWTWQDVRNWLQNDVGTVRYPNEFYQGVESTSANDSNWSDVNSLEGGEARLIWDALTGNEYGPPAEVQKLATGDGLKISGIKISYS